MLLYGLDTQQERARVLRVRWDNNIDKTTVQFPVPPLQLLFLLFEALHQTRVVYHRGHVCVYGC